MSDQPGSLTNDLRPVFQLSDKVKNAKISRRCALTSTETQNILFSWLKSYCNPTEIAKARQKELFKIFTTQN